MLNEVGVTIPDTALIQHVAEQHGRGEPIAADHKEEKQIALTIQFVKGTNASHKPCLSHLRNSYLDGLDMYPSMVQEVHNILQQREELHNIPTVEGDGITFAQGSRQDITTVTCYSCHQTGRYTNSEECPNYKGDRSGRKGATWG